MLFVILTLIFVGIFIAGLIINDRCWDTDLGLVLVAIGGFFGIIGVLSCAGFLIAEHTPYAKDTLKYELDQRVIKLNSDYEVLNRLEDKTIARVEVTAYNNEVEAFKTEVNEAKRGYKSPWLNWFINPVYKDYTGEEVKYLNE